MFQNGSSNVEEDEVDYDYSSKWEYLGKGIWENQDYGTMSNYSTLRSAQHGQQGHREDLDYETLSRSGIVSEEELEKWVEIFFRSAVKYFLDYM